MVGMRNKFASLLCECMKENEKIVVITADIGYGVLDPVRDQFPDRFYNVGAAECLMVGMAVGLAHEGFIPVCYSISTFLITRPFEFIRIYLNYYGVKVKLVGSGRDKDYGHNGVTHWAHDHDAIMAALPNVAFLKPQPEALDEAMLKSFLYDMGPAYLNLTR